jgi:hypothetical protein
VKEQPDAGALRSREAQAERQDAKWSPHMFGLFRRLMGVSYHIWAGKPGLRRDLAPSPCESFIYGTVVRRSTPPLTPARGRGGGELVGVGVSTSPPTPAPLPSGRG